MFLKINLQHLAHTVMKITLYIVLLSTYIKNTRIDKRDPYLPIFFESITVFPQRGKG